MVKIRNFGENKNIRRSLCPFPLGDGFVGIIELLRQIRLGISVLFPVISNVFCNALLQQFFRFVHSDFLPVGDAKA